MTMIARQPHLICDLPPHVREAYGAFLRRKAQARKEVVEAQEEERLYNTTDAYWRTLCTEEKVALVTVCECGTAFVRVPHPRDLENCHCPQCGNVYYADGHRDEEEERLLAEVRRELAGREHDLVAGGNVAPHVDTSAGGEG